MTALMHLSSVFVLAGIPAEAVFSCVFHVSSSEPSVGLVSGACN